MTTNSNIDIYPFDEFSVLRHRCIALDPQSAVRDGVMEPVRDAVYSVLWMDALDAGLQDTSDDH